jgi:hypothetical protein
MYFHIKKKTRAGFSSRLLCVRVEGPKVCRLGSLSPLRGERSKDLVLLSGGLETTVTVLGGSVDEFDVECLGLPGLDGREDRLSKGDRSLAGTHDTTLDEHVVLVDFTVVREATKRGNVLGHGISLSGSVVLNTSHCTSTNSVDLLVHLRSGMVAKLTATGDSPLDSGGMPGSNTGDLTETSMRLTVQTRDTESLDDTACSLTTSDSDSVDALGSLKDLTDANLLLELVLGPVDLLSDGATVDLDLEQVGFVLAEGELADLSGADHTDDSGVLLDALKITSVVGLGVGVLVLAVDVLGEGLLLGLHPVLVESALHVVVHVLGPHGGEGAQTAGGLNVTNHADDLHGGAFDDGTGVNDILLDDLLAFTTLLILDNVSHAGLVAHEGGKVDGLGGVVAGERSNAAAVVTGASLREVGQGALTGMLELTMGHFDERFYLIMINFIKRAHLFSKARHHALFKSDLLQLSRLI